MTLHTQLCFCTYFQSFFNRERNIPGATCGIAVDVVVIQLAGITSGVKCKTYPTFLISSRRIVGHHSLKVTPSILDKICFTSLISTTAMITHSSDNVQLFLGLNSKIRNFDRDVLQILATCSSTFNELFHDIRGKHFDNVTYCVLVKS